MVISTASAQIGNIEDADKYFSQATEAQKRFPGEPDSLNAWCLQTSAHIKAAKGDVDAALDLINEAYAKLTALPDSQKDLDGQLSELDCLTLAATLRGAKADFEKEIELEDRALRLMDTLPQTSDIAVRKATCMAARGGALQLEGHLTEGTAEMKKAAALAKAITSPEGERMYAECLVQVGAGLGYLRRTSEAAAALQDAADVFDSLSDPSQEQVWCLVAESMCLEPEKSLPPLEKARKVALKIQTPGERAQALAISDSLLSTILAKNPASIDRAASLSKEAASQLQLFLDGGQAEEIRALVLISASSNLVRAQPPGPLAQNSIV